MKKTIMFAGGGTMGSVSPLLSVWQELRQENEHIQGVWLGTKSGIEKEPVEHEGIVFHSISSGKWRRYFSMKNITDIFRIGMGFFQSLHYLQKYKPAVVITSGSFVCVPVAYAAWIMRIPVHLHQQDLLTGLANTLIKPVTTTVSVALPQLKKSFEHPGCKVTHTGNPLRKELLHEISREKALANFQLNPQNKTILIMGGGTGASAINDILFTGLDTLLEKYNVIHISGKGKQEKQHEHQNYYSSEFFDANQMAYAYAASDIVVSRAGMSSIMELAALKKPSIIIPIPDSHQEHNAAFLQKQEAAIILSQKNILEDTQQNTELFFRAIQDLLEDENMQRHVVSNIEKLNSKNASKKMATMITNLIPEDFSLQDIHKVYISGIGGIGTSAVARYFFAQGKSVTGSDVTKSNITMGLTDVGIQVTFNQMASNITSDIDLFIYTPALPDDHPELVKARKLNLAVYSYPDFLSLLSKQKNTIAISGTHGKSSTTAITGLLLQEGEIDPTVFVGSLVDNFEQKNVRIGMSDLLVIEACEYKAAMTHLHPQMIVLTNIEWDHPDFYHSKKEVVQAFKDFVDKLPADGLLVYNADDEDVAKIASEFHGKKIGFGKSGADVCFENVRVESGKQSFDLVQKGKVLGNITLYIPGEFNIYNVLGAISIALDQGVSFETIQKVLSEFKGIWRRFELVGKTSIGAQVISDYGHHPTAVKGTLKAAKEFYPDKRIVLVYQPHQHARTKELFKDFVSSFDDADLVLLSDIYDVAGREEVGMDIHSNDLAREVSKRNIQIIPSGNLEKTTRLLKEQMMSHDVIIIMGAGDIFTIVENVVS